MIVSYDVFTEAFLSKITEYTFYQLPDRNRQSIVDGYMKRACAQFSEVCAINIANGDDELREFDVGEDVTENELEEVVEIVSEGMVVQWFKRYMYHQENLLNLINTTDFSAYSPAELTYRITNAYKQCKRDFITRMREYSYRHGDLTVLHI